MNLRYVLKGGTAIFGKIASDAKDYSVLYDGKLYSCSRSELDNNKKYKYFEGMHKDGYSILRRVELPSTESKIYLCDIGNQTSLTTFKYNQDQTLRLPAQPLIHLPMIIIYKGVSQYSQKIINMSKFQNNIQIQTITNDFTKTPRKTILDTYVYPTKITSKTLTQSTNDLNSSCVLWSITMGFVLLKQKNIQPFIQNIEIWSNTLVEALNLFIIIRPKLKYDHVSIDDLYKHVDIDKFKLYRKSCSDLKFNEQLFVRFQFQLRSTISIKYNRENIIYILQQLEGYNIIISIIFGGYAIGICCHTDKSYIIFDSHTILPSIQGRFVSENKHFVFLKWTKDILNITQKGAYMVYFKQYNDNILLCIQQIFASQITTLSHNPNMDITFLSINK